MRRARVLVVLVALAALAALAACGGGGGGGGTDRPDGPAVASARVGLVEWDVTTSAAAVTAGKVTLRVTNAGTTEHDLHVKGRSGEVATPRLHPGESATLDVDTTAGETLDLWCSVSGHRSEGMHTQLPVA